jgi:acetyl esterase/lipase
LASPDIVVSEAFCDGRLLFELQNAITDHNIGELDEAFVLYRRQVNTSVKPFQRQSMLPCIFRPSEIFVSPNHLAISDGPGIKGVWVEAAPHLITGDVELWASIANVKPTRIPGYWVDKHGVDIPIGQKPMPGEKVLYSLHGGAYTQLSAHPKDSVGVIIRNIIRYCQPVQRAFALEYRLSSTDPLPNANPFPAALIDAVAGYYYLVNTVGFDPSNVIIEGDSAGGNLAIALTRYLVEHRDRPEIPPAPNGLILVSPWTDLSNSHDGPNSSLTTSSADYLIDPNSMCGLWSKQAFVGPHGLGAACFNRYISPASLRIAASFTDFPKTFLVTGGAEKLYDSILTLKNKMVADMGEGDGEGQVTYYECPDAVHDYIAFPWYEPERTDTLRAIAKWI